MTFYFIGQCGSGVEQIVEILSKSFNNIKLCHIEELGSISKSGNYLVHIKCPKFIRKERIMRDGRSELNAIIQIEKDREKYCKVDSIVNTSIYNTVLSSCLEEITTLIKEKTR